jgi:hypothetical protein
VRGREFLELNLAHAAAADTPAAKDQSKYAITRAALARLWKRSKRQTVNASSPRSGGGDRRMAVEGGARLWTHAPSTMLRMVPLPRLHGGG